MDSPPGSGSQGGKPAFHEHHRGNTAAFEEGSSSSSSSDSEEMVEVPPLHVPHAFFSTKASSSSQEKSASAAGSQGGTASDRNRHRKHRRVIISDEDDEYVEMGGLPADTHARWSGPGNPDSSSSQEKRARASPIAASTAASKSSSVDGRKSTLKRSADKDKVGWKIRKIVDCKTKSYGRHTAKSGHKWYQVWWAGAAYDNLDAPGSTSWLPQGDVDDTSIKIYHDEGERPFPDLRPATYVHRINPSHPPFFPPNPRCTVCPHPPLPLGGSIV